MSVFGKSVCLFVSPTWHKPARGPEITLRAHNAKQIKKFIINYKPGWNLPYYPMSIYRYMALCMTQFQIEGGGLLWDIRVETQRKNKLKLCQLSWQKLIDSLYFGSEKVRKHSSFQRKCLNLIICFVWVSKKLWKWKNSARH